MSLYTQTGTIDAEAGFGILLRTELSFGLQHNHDNYGDFSHNECGDDGKRRFCHPCQMMLTAASLIHTMLQSSIPMGMCKTLC